MQRKWLLLLCLIFVFSFSTFIAAEGEDETLLICDFEENDNFWVGYDIATEKIRDPKTVTAENLHIGDFHFNESHMGVYAIRGEGFILDKKNVKSGKSSGKWANTVTNNRIAGWKIPHDWSEYGYLSVWVYSEVANKAGFAITAYSEDDKPKDDYFTKAIIVNWTGWKLIEIPFTEFTATRSPVGWNKVDYIKISSSGWGLTPMPETVLYFDRMQLTKESAMNETLNSIPVDFKINERPGLFVNAAELKEAKAKAAKHEWAKIAYDKLKQTADQWVSKEIKLPETGGGFFHAGGDDYQITAQHYQFAEVSRDLALMYWLDGNEAYAKKAAEILIGYAAKYQGYEIHDKEGNKGKKAMSGGGKVTSQAINEATWVVDVAFAYDLLYNRFSAEERKNIEDNLFRPAAKLIMNNNEGRHNHQTWYNTGVGVIGFLLKDPKLVRYALYKFDSGFFFQMENSLTRDGYWYEGSAHYHLFAIESLKALSLAAYHSGFNLYENKAYSSMYSFPIVYEDPDGNLPLINDGRKVTLSDDSRAYLFESAYRYTKDPYIVPILKKAPRATVDSLLYGVAELPEVKLPAFKSMELDGLVVLRSGSGEKIENYAVVNGLPYGGGHSDYDKMSVLFYANGQMQAQDAGTIRYRDPLMAGWFKTTLAHNTVVVDEKNQIYSAQANMLTFAAGPVVQMTRLQEDRTYLGSMLDRSVLLTDWYMFDLFRVDSKESRTADWTWHNYGKFSTDLKLSPVTLTAKDGYKALENTMGAKVTDPYKLVWDNGSNKLEITQLSKEATQLFRGEGHVSTQDWDLSGEKLTAAIVRKVGKDVVFSSLIVPVKGDFKYTVTPFAYKFVNKTPPTQPTGAYKIASVKSEDLIFYTYANGETAQFDKYETNAQLAFVRKQKGVETEAFFANGSYMAGKKWRVETEELIAGPTGAQGVVHVSFAKKSLQIKVDATKVSLVHFSGKKMKSLEMLVNGKWEATEPIDNVKGKITIMADPGATYRVNF